MIINSHSQYDTIFKLYNLYGKALRTGCCKIKTSSQAKKGSLVMTIEILTSNTPTKIQFRPLEMSQSLV